MNTNSILQAVSALSLAALLTSNALAQRPSARSSARIYESGNQTVITNADSSTQLLTYTQGGRRVTELRRIEQPSTQRFEFNPGSRARDSIMQGVRPAIPMPETDLQVDEATGNVGPITLFSIPF